VAFFAVGIVVAGLVIQALTKGAVVVRHSSVTWQCHNLFPITVAGAIRSNGTVFAVPVYMMGVGVVQKLKTGSTVGGYFPIWF